MTDGDRMNGNVEFTRVCSTVLSEDGQSLVETAQSSMKELNTFYTLFEAKVITI